MPSLVGLTFNRKGEVLVVRTNGGLRLPRISNGDIGAFSGVLNGVKIKKVKDSYRGHIFDKTGSRFIHDVYQVRVERGLRGRSQDYTWVDNAGDENLSQGTREYLEHVFSPEYSPNKHHIPKLKFVSATG